jgi:hypothetical protein
MACTNVIGNLILPVANFKGKERHSEFGDDFPNDVFVTITDSEWISEKYFHELATSFSVT